MHTCKFSIDDKVGMTEEEDKHHPSMIDFSKLMAPTWSIGPVSVSHLM